MRNKTYVMRSDDTGCGMFRMHWPAEYICAAYPEFAHRVISVAPSQRGSLIQAGLDRNGDVVKSLFPNDMATIVLQRVTFKNILQCIPFWQEAGIRVVIDVDDDLSCIHPTNRAFGAYKPTKGLPDSYLNLFKACQIADTVTVTTPALADRYRDDAVVIPNYLPDQYYGLERTDNTDLMWPASFGTHPNDYEPCGPVVQRVQRETNVKVRMLGADKAFTAFQRAFGVTPEITNYVHINHWPKLLASIGVAFVPLADTMFNAAKSWLKLLELSACGVPWVASPRADYRRFVTETGHGILADRPNEWRRELKKLINDAGWRQEQSVRGREVAEPMRLKNHIDEWFNAWGLSTNASLLSDPFTVPR